MNLKNKIQLEAVCELEISKCESISKKNNKFKIKIFRDYHKMIKECDLDLVSILTPSGMHYEHATDIIKKHKVDLILEKPPTLRVKNLQKLFNLAKQKKINIFPVFQNRTKAVQFLKKSIFQGKLGKINICSVK